MFDNLKKTWHMLREAEPGKRFQQYNEHHQASRRSNASKVLSVVIGVVIVAVGIVALPAPGPGTLVIAIGAALIARESRVVAKALDWLELRIRAVVKRAVGVWKAASPPARIALGAVGVGLLGVAVYFAYTFTIGRA